MRKAIIIVATALLWVAAGLTTAEAQGGARGGFGQAFSPAFGRSSGPDPTILGNVDAAQRRAPSRGYGYVIERRRATAPAARSAKVKADKDAQAERAKRAARLAAIAEAKTAAARARKASAVSQRKNNPVSGPVVTEAAPVDSRKSVPGRQIEGARPVSATTPAAPAADRDCKRFIPGAAVTVSVACSE